MPRGGAHFTAQEIADVLEHYDLGTITQQIPLRKGNPRAPKRILITDTGSKFLLKRRPRGKDNIYHVAFTHAVINHLAQKNFPVPKLIPAKTNAQTALYINNRVYEIYQLVEGIRSQGTNLHIKLAAEFLAKMHLDIADFCSHCTEKIAPKHSFHNCPAVFSHLRYLIRSPKTPFADRQIKQTAQKLLDFYTAAGQNVSRLGFDTWHCCVIHGDWHPGNLIFSEKNNSLNAVLDFDSAMIAPPILDLANALLQFSIIGGKDPQQWPDYLDMDKFKLFINTYLQHCPLTPNQLQALPSLMIETMIAEAVLPIVATGCFANHSGKVFLEMILRKTVWINKNFSKLIALAET